MTLHFSGFSLVYKAAWSHNDASRETPTPQGMVMSVRRDGELYMLGTPMTTMGRTHQARPNL